MRFLLYILFPLCALFTNCNLNDSQKVPLQIIQLNGESASLGESTYTTGQAHSGNRFSRIDNKIQFGLGYSFILSDSLINKDLKIKISSWFRTNVLQSKGAIVVSTARNDSMLSWNTIYITNSILEPNVWSQFTDSIIVNRTVGKVSFNKIAIFSYLGSDANELLDTDDLTISLQEN